MRSRHVAYVEVKQENKIIVKNQIIFAQLLNQQWFIMPTYYC